MEMKEYIVMDTGPRQMDAQGFRVSDSSSIELCTYIDIDTDNFLN